MGKKRKENTKKKENDSNQKNEAYFESLLRTRGGVHVLQIAPAGLFVALLCLAVTWSTAIYGYNMNPWKSIINWVLIGICIMLAITFLLVASQRAMQVLVKHQGLLGIWECCVSIIYTFTLMLGAYLLSQFNEVTRVQYGSLFSLIVIALFFSVYISCLIYN